MQIIFLVFFMLVFHLINKIKCKIKRSIKTLTQGLQVYFHARYPYVS